jgi:hypothetical protein
LADVLATRGVIEFGGSTGAVGAPRRQARGCAAWEATLSGEEDFAGSESIALSFEIVSNSRD